MSSYGYIYIRFVDDSMSSYGNIYIRFVYYILYTLYILYNILVIISVDRTSSYHVTDTLALFTSGLGILKEEVLRQNADTQDQHRPKDQDQEVQRTNLVLHLKPNPAPHLGTNPAPHLGTNPAPHLGTNPVPHLETNPAVHKERVQAQHETTKVSCKA